MSTVATPLLDQIEADEEAPPTQQAPQTRAPAREPVVLTPGAGGGTRALDRLATTPADAEAGIAGIFRQVRPRSLHFPNHNLTRKLVCSPSRTVIIIPVPTSCTRILYSVWLLPKLLCCLCCRDRCLSCYGLLEYKECRRSHSGRPPLLESS